MTQDTSTSPTAASADIFWNWFVANEASLFSIGSGEDAAFASLARALQSVHSDLTFEIGPVRQGRREFVISADGLRQAFPAVELLHARAPSLARWTWVKFRPPRHPLSTITVEDVTLRTDQVRYLLARDEDDNRVGIVLFMDGYDEGEQKAFQRAGYLLLDEALGEFAMETKVGFIDFHSPNSDYYAHSLPISALATDFAQYWTTKSR